MYGHYHRRRHSNQIRRHHLRQIGHSCRRAFHRRRFSFCRFAAKAKPLRPDAKTKTYSQPLSAACSNTCGNGLAEGGEVCDAGALNGVSCVPALNNTCVYCSRDCLAQIQNTACGTIDVALTGQYPPFDAAVSSSARTLKNTVMGVFKIKNNSAGDTLLNNLKITVNISGATSTPTLKVNLYSTAAEIPRDEWGQYYIDANVLAPIPATASANLSNNSFNFNNLSLLDKG